MLTQIEMEIIQKYAVAMSRTAIFEVDWDPASKTLRPTKSRSKRSVSLLYTACSAIQVWLTLNTALQLMSNKTQIMNLGVRAMPLFILPPFCLVFLWHLVFVLRKEDLVSFFNQMMSRSLKDGISQSVSVRAKLFRHSQHAMYVLAAGLNPLVILDEYFQKSADNWCLIPLLISLVNTAWVACLGVLLFAVTVLYIYMFLTITNDGLRKQKRASDLARMVHNYRSLALLTHLFNVTVCREIVPSLKYLFCFVAMMGFSIAIGLRTTEFSGNAMKWVFISSALYIWGGLIVGTNMMSSVWYSGSAHVRRLERLSLIQASTKSLNELQEQLTTIKSLAPIRVTIGGLYHMEKEAKCTFINFIIVGTTNLVLVLSSK